MVLTVSFVLSPVTGLVCHRHQRSRLRELDASVGASGPHDFAVRKSAPSSLAPPASTASRPASVTIAIRPSGERDGGDIEVIWVKREAEYFCRWGLDSPNQFDRAGEFGLNAPADLASFRGLNPPHGSRRRGIYHRPALCEPGGASSS